MGSLFSRPAWGHIQCLLSAPPVSSPPVLGALVASLQCSAHTHSVSSFCRNLHLRDLEYSPYPWETWLVSYEAKQAVRELSCLNAPQDLQKSSVTVVTKSSVTVVMKSSCSFPCSIPASSCVVSSTGDEASLGGSHLHFTAVTATYNFLAPPSVKRGCSSWLNWGACLKGFNKVNLRTMMCCARSAVIWVCEWFFAFVFEWCPDVFSHFELWKHVHAAADVFVLLLHVSFPISYFFTSLWEASLFRKCCQTPSWLLFLPVGTAVIWSVASPFLQITGTSSFQPIIGTGYLRHIDYFILYRTVLKRFYCAKNTKHREVPFSAAVCDMNWSYLLILGVILLLLKTVSCFTNSLLCGFWGTNKSFNVLYFVNLECGNRLTGAQNTVQTWQLSV